MTYVPQRGFLAALWPCFYSGSSAFFIICHHGSFTPQQLLSKAVTASLGTWHCVFFLYTFSLCFLFSNCELLYQELLVIMVFISLFSLEKEKGFILFSTWRILKILQIYLILFYHGLGGAVWRQRLLHQMSTQYSDCSHYSPIVKQVPHSMGIGGLTRRDQMVREDKL